MKTALTCLLLAAVLGLASAGVSNKGKIEYPGKTGAFPPACDNGVNEGVRGAPSADIPLGDSRAVQHVSGNKPEQIHITMGANPSTMYVSWTTGNASYTFCGNGEVDGNATSGCFKNRPVAQKTDSVVQYGTADDVHRFKSASDAGAFPSQEQYQMIYGIPNAGNNYTSPIVHHVKLTGLKPETQYYYRVGDGKTFSKVLSFTTLPAPGKNKATKIAVLADVGTTEATYDVLKGIEAEKPDITFLAGDHCYADNHGNDQRYWDSWMRLLSETTASSVPWQPAFGNHEEETQYNQCLIDALVKNGTCGDEAFVRANCPGSNCPCWNGRLGGERGGLPAEFVYENCHLKSAFVSALARWPTPYEEAGSPAQQYYSFKFGLVHAIVLTAYEPYCGGSLPCAVYQPGLKVLPSGNSAQYEWLAREVKKVNKKETPWVITFFHNPWYTTYGGFKTEDCSRQALEPLLQAAGVDLVFSGHIHAYERSNPVHNFKTDPQARTCDPTHIVVGDAGNDETLNCPLIDRGLSNGKLNCAGSTVEGGVTEGYYFKCISHTFQDSPYSCMANDDRVNTTSPLGASYFGCQDGGFCPNKQPIWSAFRSSAYGSGLLTIKDAKTATWSWKGGYKGAITPDNTVTTDEVTFTRCDNTLPYQRK